MYSTSLNYLFEYNDNKKPSLAVSSPGKHYLKKGIMLLEQPFFFFF